MPTYEFKQPDGSYQSKTVDTDMSNTAGYLSGNIRAVQTVIPQAVTPVTPAVTPVTPTTPATPTPTTPIVTTQTTPTPTNKRIKINNPAALAQGTTLTANDIIKEGNDIYLKAGVAIPKGQESYFSMVDSPIKTGATASNILSQNTLQNVSGDMSETERTNSIISKGWDTYTQAIQNATSLQSPSSTLRQDLYAETNFTDLSKQLTDTDNALRNLDDDIRSQYAGRDITESQLQALVAKESEPILRSRQYLADQVNSIKQQVSEQVADAYTAFSTQWQQAQGNAQLQSQYMTNLQNYANQLYERSRNENLDYMSAMNFSLNLPEGQTVTLPDGTTIEGRKVNDNLSTQIETDSFGNSTLVMFDKTAVANALKQGKTPQITKVNLGQIGNGISIDDRIKLLNANLTYDPNTGQLVQDVSKASVEQIAEAIKTIESNGNYNAKGGSGEFGAYQFMPSTWYGWSREYQQATGKIPSATPENQDAVAQFKINQWLSQGLTPEQIFAKWNSGSEVGWESKIGTNKYGQNYNVPNYVNKGINTLRNIVAQQVVDTKFTPEFYATDYGQKVLNNEQQYQTNFLSQPLVKSYLEVANKAESVSKIIDAGVGGPGDLALVFEFMKGLDPSSVVRESEYEAAAKSGNIFLGTLAKFNGYLKEEGGMLPDNVKESFRSIVNTKLDVYEAQYNQLRDQFRTTAEQQGLNPDHVAPDLTIDFGNNYQSGTIVEVNGIKYISVGNNQFIPLQ